MRLFRSEVLRARSRRLVPMVIVGGLLTVFVSLGIAAINSHPPSQADLDQAQARFEQQFQRCMAGKYLGPGQEVPAGFDSLEEFCRENSGPFIGDVGMQLRDLPQIFQGVSTFVIMLGALLGASLGGADWTSDTITTLLTWEPRRVKVLLTRAAVVVLFAFVITIGLQAIFAAVFWLGASTRGTTAFTPSGVWSDAGQTLLRTSTVATAFALIALSIAMIGRSTVSSLGALVGYLILFEGVIAGFRPSIQGWLLVRAGIVVVSQTPILHYVSDSYYSSTSPAPEVLMSVGRANAVVGVYVVVLLVLALIIFRRRDVS
jgi:ABC-type transport system involved in multi-copper enzyme maturation permease subunit